MWSRCAEASGYCQWGRKLKLPAIELPASLGKIPGLSRLVKAKGASAGAARGASGAKGGGKGQSAGVPTREQQAVARLDLTQKGFAVLATVLILLALYTVFSQNGLLKAILTAAPPTIDLAELAAAGPELEADETAQGAKAAKSAKSTAPSRVKLPEGTDARLDFAFEQIANFENTRSEAILREGRATVAGVAPGSPAARAGFITGDYILGVDGEQSGFVWDSLRKLTAAGKSSVLIEVQRDSEVLRGELFAPEGELLTSANSGLYFQIPEGYRFVGENDRRDLRNAFTRSYLEGLAGDERLAYATSLAILGANLMKRGVAQTKLRPDDPNWLKTEVILSDHHNKFNKVLTNHTAQIEGMQAQLQSGFVKVGAYLLASLLAAVAALAAALQHQRHLAEHHAAQLRAQFQGLRAEVDQWMHSQKAVTDLAARSARGSDSTGRADEASAGTPVAAESFGTGSFNAGRPVGARAGVVPTAGVLAAGLFPSGSSPPESSLARSAAAGPAPVPSLSLTELAARVALGGDMDDDAPRAPGSRTPGIPPVEAGDRAARVPFSVFQPESAPASPAASSDSAGPEPVSTFAAGRHDSSDFGSDQVLSVAVPGSFSEAAAAQSTFNEPPSAGAADSAPGADSSPGEDSFPSADSVRGADSAQSTNPAPGADPTPNSDPAPGADPANTEGIPAAQIEGVSAGTAAGDRRTDRKVTTGDVA
jgi:hypothetical protein